MAITLHQLRILSVVASEGSVTRAADKLHLTQPTLSIQLRQLAEAIGEPVLEAVGRRVYLTGAGHEVLATARALEGEFDALRARLAARRGIEQGRLRLSVVSTAEYFMPRVLGEFQRAHPGIEVSLQVLNRAAVVERLHANEDDLYVMTRPPEDGTVRAEPMGANPLVVVAAPTHEWRRRRRIPAKALAAQPFVVREPGSGTRAWAERWLASRGLRMDARLELGSNEAVKGAVRGGFGVAIVSAHAVLLEVTHGLITVLDVVGFPLPSQWHLVTRAGKASSPVAAVFRTYLKREAMPDLARTLALGLARRPNRRQG